MDPTLEQAAQGRSTPSKGSDAMNIKITPIPPAPPPPTFKLEIELTESEMVDLRTILARSSVVTNRALYLAVANALADIP